MKPAFFSFFFGIIKSVVFGCSLLLGLTLALSISFVIYNYQFLIHFVGCFEIAASADTLLKNRILMKTFRGQ